MSKVTSKLQVTIPKALADRYGIVPGVDVQFEAAGSVVRMVPPRVGTLSLSRAERLRVFDEATARQEARNRLELAAAAGTDRRGTDERHWTREELYDRGRAD